MRLTGGGDCQASPAADQNSGGSYLRGPSQTLACPLNEVKVKGLGFLVYTCGWPSWVLVLLSRLHFPGVRGLFTHGLHESPATEAHTSVFHVCTPGDRLALGSCLCWSLVSSGLLFLWLETVLFHLSLSSNSHNDCYKSSGCLSSHVAGKLAISYQELAYLLAVRPVAGPLIK